MNSDYYKTIADEAMLAIVVVNGQTEQITYANARALEILEISPDENLLLIEPKEFCCDPMEGDFKSFQCDIMKNPSFNEDVWMKGRSGKLFISRLRVQHIESLNGRLVVMMFEDATFEKKLQREIQTKQENLESMYQEVLEQNEALKALDKAKDKFMALTTHELRTPLSAIVATLDVLDMGMYDNQQQLDEFIDTMVAEARHLMEIVNDILDMAKIQAGKMDFYIQEDNLNTLLQGKISNFEQMAANKGVTLELQDGDQPKLAYFDELRLGQVVANVVNNAIKFNVEKGFVRIRVEDNGDLYRIIIQDSGKGIPKERFEKVFNEFETVGSVDTHQKGTGLGMPISKRLVEAMGGKITFDSEVGKGTTFMIDVPRTKVLGEEHYRLRPELGGDLLQSA